MPSLSVMSNFETLRSDRIQVRYRRADAALAADTMETLKHAAVSLAAYFQLTGSLPRIRAFLAADRDAFDHLVADRLRVEIEHPSDPRRIAQAQKGDMVLLSPSAYETHSAYRYVPDDYRRMVRHELVHVIQEHLSPGIEQSPLWWDEGLAVYLSGQWQVRGQFRFRESVEEHLRDGRMPLLPDVLDRRELAYAFGWTLVRFIEQHMGRDIIVHVVKTMKDGDVLSAITGDPERFHMAWTAWLQSGAALRS